MGSYEPPLFTAVKFIINFAAMVATIIVASIASAIPVLVVVMPYSWAMAEYMPPATDVLSTALYFPVLLIGATLMGGIFYWAYKAYGEKIMSKLGTEKFAERLQL